MDLVTGLHFRSRDKYGGHTIRSAVVESPMVHADFTAVCFIEQIYRTGVIAELSLHCGNENFRPFGSCDLDLDPMTFIYELDPYCLKLYRMCKYELPTSRPSKVIV